MWQLPEILMNIWQGIQESIYVRSSIGLSYYILANTLKNHPSLILGFC